MSSPVKTPKGCVTVAWVGNAPPAGDVEELDAPFQLAPCEPDDVHGAQLAVVDTRSFESTESFARTYAALTCPTLVLCGRDESRDMGSRLRETDLMCLREAPLPIVIHHVTHLLVTGLFRRDGLTGLAARPFALSQLEQLMPEAGESRPLAFLLADIDHFKAVNDEHGHMAGDQVLQELARLLQDQCQGAWLVSRFGGEEFGVVLDGGEEEVYARAEAIRNHVEATTFSSDIIITLSLGFATTHAPCDVQELVRCADEALYAAKAEGRNCVRSYERLKQAANNEDRDLALANLENLTRVVSERIVSTITRRSRRLFSNLKQEAEVDALTGLYNRRGLDRRAEREVAEACAMGAPLGVALLDIDHFGEINKQFGWPSGDKVLAELGELIRTAVRNADWAGRYGGEEFCLVMPGTKADQCYPVLERVRQAVEAYPFRSTSDERIHVTASIGVSEREKEERDFAPIVERASERLLQAKGGGRNRVC